MNGIRALVRTGLRAVLRLSLSRRVRTQGEVTRLQPEKGFSPEPGYAGSLSSTLPAS